MQNLVLELQAADGDLTNKEIYWYHVYPQFGISERTFYSWLTIPAKAQLKRMNQKDDDNQLKMF